jgi:hypothetical protein
MAAAAWATSATTASTARTGSSSKNTSAEITYVAGSPRGRQGGGIAVSVRFRCMGMPLGRIRKLASAAGGPTW